jgi:ABC-type sugar transport system permease subunit
MTNTANDSSQASDPLTRHDLPVARRRRGRAGGSVWWRALPYLLPAFAILLIFRLFPVLYAGYLSVFTVPIYDGTPTFIGLVNYEQMLNDQTMHASLWNNLMFLLTFPLWIALPLLSAVLVFQRIFGYRTFRALMFFPVLMSPVIIGSYYTGILQLDGPVNTALEKMGLGFLAQHWLVDVDTALPVVLAIWIWGLIGLGMLFFLNGLASIDPELWDAAEMDGAGWWTRLRYVTIPMLRPTLEFWIVLVVLGIFSGLFPLITTLTRGGPGNRTMVVDLYIYLTGFSGGRFSYASAVGMVVFVFVGAIVFFYLWFSRRREARS